MAKAASAKIINIGAANCGMAKQWHHGSSIISEGVSAAGGVKNENNRHGGVAASAMAERNRRNGGQISK
jgi:hypothetical protein